MKVAFYGRVSTVSQAERDLSLPDQQRQVEAWAKGNGHSIVARFVDAGKSATNDRRPEFRKMIAEATSGQAHFEAIVVHSLSRFYRDQTELMLHVRELRKHNVNLLSITQATSEDLAGDMIMRMIAMFDEFSSRENSKHVLRAMLKNAEDGYYNGSTVPFGYQAVELPILGCKGRHRKRLEINPVESRIVVRAFDLYLSRDMGIKDIVSRFNDEGILWRGKLWNIGVMHRMLRNPVYVGRKLFNQRHWESGMAKTKEEVVTSAVPAIISDEVFILTAKKLHERSPKQSHPRALTSPHLLTGLVKCGTCGASMTMATGKNNTYFYYRCSTKSKKGAKLCDSKAVRMDKLDRMVLECLATKVLTPERVTAIIRELKRRVLKDGENLNDLTKQLEIVQHKLKNLYNAIAEGLLNPTDPILAEQLETLQEQRSVVENRITDYKQTAEAAIQEIGSQQVKQFTSVVQKKLLDTSGKLPKEYLKLLLKEIVVDGTQVRLVGDPTKMACAVKIAAKTKNLSTQDEVLRFNIDWRAR